MHDSHESVATAEGLSGMTVNERLVTCSLVGTWDEAVMDRDKERMISVLLKVAISPDDAEAIARTVLADPKKYGF